MRVFYFCGALLAAAATIADLEFPSPEHVVQGDPEFQTCFRDTVKRVRFPCAACEEGQVVFGYPIQRFFNITKDDTDLIGR